MSEGMEDTSLAGPKEASCLLYISNWIADMICLSSCGSRDFNCLAKAVATGSSPLLAVECFPGPPALLDSRGSIGDIHTPPPPPGPYLPGV